MMRLLRPRRRDERGQGSLEHLGAYILVSIIVGALVTTVVTINPRIGEWIVYEACKVVQLGGGGECTPPDPPRTAEDRVPEAPCTLDADTYNVSAQVSVVVTVKKGWVYITERLSDGTYRVTRIREDALGISFGPGFDASVTIDGKKYGIVGNVSADALLAAKQGSTWYANSQSEADQIIEDSLKEEVIDTTVGGPPLVGDLLSWGAKKIVGEPPKPDETYVEAGVQLSAEAAVSNVLFQGQGNVAAEGYAGFKETPDGYTVYIKGKANASLSMGGIWGPSDDPSAGAEFIYEAHYDRNWNPTGLTMTTATYAQGSDYDEDDTKVVTEHVFHVPVTDDRTRELFDDALINPLAFFDVSDEAKRSGSYARNTYDVNDNMYGATVTGKLLGEYGGGISGGHQTKDLTNAEYWDGNGFSRRPDCDV